MPMQTEHELLERIRQLEAENSELRDKLEANAKYFREHMTAASTKKHLVA